MRPSAYKHIAAFGILIGHTKAVIRRKQRRAAETNAPVDAVYDSLIFATGERRWFTIAEVGVQTRMSIERILNHGVSK